MSSLNLLGELFGLNARDLLVNIVNVAFAFHEFSVQVVRQPKVLVHPPAPSHDCGLIKLVIVCDVVLVGQMVYDNAIVRAFVKYLRAELLGREY